MILWPAVKLKNWLYDREILQSCSLKTSVISVGNLTAGGTGKTPVCLHLIGEFLKNSHRVGLVSRGYRGTYQGVKEVRLDGSEGPDFFGDEPFLIKTRFPEVPVFVSPNRCLAGKELLAMQPLDYLIADDAFQHRALKRDFDIVLIDSLAPASEYRLLPFGRGREPLSSLKRASQLILTRFNLAPEDQRNWLLETFSGRGQHELVLSDQSIVPRWPESANSSGQSPTRLILVSGIGRPSQFEEMVQSRGFEVLEHHERRDHAHYSPSDVDELVERALHQNALVGTTEKDAVKLNAAGFPRESLLVFSLDVGFSKNLVNRIKESIV